MGMVVTTKTIVMANIMGTSILTLVVLKVGSCCDLVFSVLSIFSELDNFFHKICINDITFLEIVLTIEIILH